LTFSKSALVAEFLGTAMFVAVGCGAGYTASISCSTESMSCSTADNALSKALVFGLAFSVLLYSFGHYSGYQLNCASTVGLMIGGDLNKVQGLLNIVAQCVGAVAGAALLLLIHPKADVSTNSVQGDSSWSSALNGEIIGTFFLVFTILQTAVHPKSKTNRAHASLAIGFAVFVAHVLLIPIDGCSLNPARSFGPAVVMKLSNHTGAAHFADHEVFWLGPLIGAAVAAGVFKLLEHEGSARSAQSAEAEPLNA